MAEVTVFVEQRSGQVKRVALEVVAQGRRLADAWGGSLEAILIGTDLDDAAAKVLPLGSDHVTLLEHPVLSDYSVEGFTQALSGYVARTNPLALLLPATAMGMDLAPRVAARLRVGLASDCISISSGPDRTMEAVRPVFSGKAMATVRFSSARPVMATLRPNVFPPGEPVANPAGKITKKTPELDETKIRARLTGLEKDQSGEIDVKEADIVVSGGRAMMNSENFGIIRDLAAALGGAVGASRAAVDAGFIAHQHQVGQTGKVVAPKLYIACGISGAIQHLAGMSSSKVIVAINKDGEAPIFKIATYGIVGDLFRIVPLLTEKILKLKAE